MAAHDERGLEPRLLKWQTCAVSFELKAYGRSFCWQRGHFNGIKILKNSRHEPSRISTLKPLPWLSLPGKNCRLLRNSTLLSFWRFLLVRPATKTWCVKPANFGRVFTSQSVCILDYKTLCDGRAVIKSNIEDLQWLMRTYRLRAE